MARFRCASAGDQPFAAEIVSGYFFFAQETPLDYRLRNGDRIEVVTANSGGPSLDWLNESLGFVVSHRAKQKIRDARIAFEIPVGEELMRRLDEYLMHGGVS